MYEYGIIGVTCSIAKGIKEGKVPWLVSLLELYDSYACYIRLVIWTKLSLHSENSNSALAGDDC